MNVVVIGAGRVGLANAIYLAEEHFVTLVDKNPNIIASLKMGENPYQGSEFGKEFSERISKIQLRQDLPPEFLETAIVITTPSESVNEILSELDTTYISAIIIKSTLSLEMAIALSKAEGPFWKKLIGFPEFLVEGEEVDGVDSGRQNFVSTVTCHSEYRELFDIFEKLYGNIRYTEFQHFAIPFFIKVWTNVGLAMKVTLANGIRESIPNLDLMDVNEILQGVEADPRIGSGYLKPGIGYGGSCLPFAVEQIQDIHPFNCIQDYNEYIPTRIVSSIGSQSVLVFGYNFKQGVADYRNANQLRTILELVNRGIKVYVSDDFYDDIVKEWWVSNPLGVLDKVDTVIIFYQTKQLEKIEKYLNWDTQSKEAMIWNNLHKIDFR